jgi:hypothetical protein
MPIQIIESKKLTREGNLWLRDLSVGLRGQDVSAVLEESRLVRADMRVDAYVYAILQANAEAVSEELLKKRAVPRCAPQGCSFFNRVYGR